jgi:hypothetical protein
MRTCKPRNADVLLKKKLNINIPYKTKAGNICLSMVSTIFMGLVSNIYQYML